MDEVVQHRGVFTTADLTAVPGLACIGTPWLVDMGSANLVGLERDVTSLVQRLLEDR